MTHPQDVNRPWLPHLIWFLAVALPVTWLIIGAGQTEQQPGQCSGIGWGCSLSGSDAAAFVAIIVVPPALAILAIGHGVIGVVQWLRGASRKNGDRH